MSTNNVGTGRGRLSREQMDATYIRGVVSDTPPLNPTVGMVWFGPYVGEGVTPPVTLDTTPNLVARWEANKLVGADGSSVVSFAPTSGTWTTPLVAPAAAPKIKASAVNGRKALSFTAASSTFMELDHPDLTGPTTEFIVCDLRTSGTVGGRAISSMTSTSYRAVRLSSTAGNGGMLTSGSAPNSIYDSWSETSGWRIIAAVFDGATSRLHPHKRTAKTSATNLVVQADLRLGRGPGTSTEYSDIDIADLAIVDRAMTDAEVKSVMDELAVKYGQTLGA